jgi:hypothetical protein
MGRPTLEGRGLDVASGDELWAVYYRDDAGKPVCFALVADRSIADGIAQGVDYDAHVVPAVVDGGNGRVIAGLGIGHTDHRIVKASIAKFRADEKMWRRAR